MTRTKMFNVLIADDHELIRQAMQKLLMHLQPRLVSHLVADWDELLQALSQTKMDLAIVDLHMPGSDMQKFVTLARDYPDLPVVVVSAESNPDVVQALFAEGNIKGFVPKTDQASVLFSALQLVLSGGKYIPSLMLSNNKVAAPFVNPQTSEGWDLSGRLQEILVLLSQGLSNKMIARQLGISDLTVKTHISMLFRHMGVKNRAEAIALYLRQTLGQ